MENNHLDSIVLGGGCFWCVEAVYQQVEGIHEIVSGYAGDTEETANYDAVCSGRTKHAEVVKVSYDPSTISLEEVFEIFWATHNPTTPNQQGNDRGPQYRSIIFYKNEEEKRIAEKSKSNVAPKIWDDPIVTEIDPLEAFFPAETHHQNYYSNVGDRNPYCTYVITPKVQKVRKAFADKLKNTSSS
ncbi:MAG: peptide-methionine (S)-S-oxide reductase MsrA [Saprospiraceae bacterium]|jgi:methionine-S-sulfoxide reductase|nr:peptide-methionine (S)-S-oxide reductase MsrA [Saprospiraceae bacterium]